MTRRLRAAVIGLGVGEQHAVGYAECDGSELVAICDTDSRRLEEVAARFPGVATAVDADEILSRSDIDVVSVASYDHFHFPQVRRALETDKHVIVEKPAFVTPDEAASIRALLAEKPHLRLTTNVPLRLEPRFVAVREMIMNGQFGEIYHLEGDYDYGRRFKLTDGWRGREPGYSVVLGGAIHLIDLLTWMTGLTVRRVCGAVGTNLATRGSIFHGLDTVTAIMETDTGATMKVTANFGSVSRHFHGVRIYGTKATFVNGLPDATVYTHVTEHAEGKAQALKIAYPVAAKSGLVREFISSIHGAKSDVVPCDEVFRALNTCFMIERALGRVDSPDGAADAD